MNSGECGLVQCSWVWWNGRQNDHLSNKSGVSRRPTRDARRKEGKSGTRRTKRGVAVGWVDLADKRPAERQGVQENISVSANPGNRRADGRLPGSPLTVGAKVKCSPGVQSNALPRCPQSLTCPGASCPSRTTLALFTAIYLHPHVPPYAASTHNCTLACPAPCLWVIARDLRQETRVRTASRQTLRPHSLRRLVTRRPALDRTAEDGVTGGYS